MGPGTTTMTWPQVLARRLARHHLAEPSATADPAAVASAVCGVHAQVLSAAEWSVGVRLAGATRADVADALWGDRSLLKTVGPRGTLHLFAAEDLPLWTGAASTLPDWTFGYPEEVRFTSGEVDEVVTAMAEVLAAGELTADELTEALVGTVGSWAVEPRITGFQQEWPRWRLAVYPAARRGVLCYGANRGRAVTYTNPGRWRPGLAPDEPEEAAAELVLRYLHAYGPATPEEVARWVGAPKGWATARFGALGDRVEPVEVDGRRGWVAAGDTAVPDDPPRGVRLLPYFDAYGVGSHPRSRVFPGRASERALSGGQAGNYPVLLVDGTVAGVWHQRRSGRRVAITVEPIGRLTAARRSALEDEVERIGRFFGGVASLTVGEVAVGPHA